MSLIPRSTPMIYHHKQSKPMNFDTGGAMPMSMAEPWFARRSDPIEAYHPGGLYEGSTGGRTDNIANMVPAGAYVVPADVVSGLGEGTTHAGAAVLDKMFHSNPHGIQGSKVSGGHGVGIPSSAPPRTLQYAKGGKVRDHVPVITASGEFLILPEDLVNKFGDLKRAHHVMDEFVKHVRRKTIKEMQNLKKPVGSK